MDDRLQRRLRDADPLTAADGTLPDAARLDAIKEHLMQTQAQPEPQAARPAWRPRAAGLTALAATGLAAVLIVGTFARPSAAALAWDPTPTSITDSQKADATAACAAGLPAVVGGGPVGGVGLAVPAPSGLPQLEGVTTITGTATVGGATTSNAAPVTVSGDGGPVPSLPAIPAKLPPLVVLELHGTGGVAVFADDKISAYCLLVKDGDKLVSGGIEFPNLGNGAAVGFGTIAAGLSGATSSGMMSMSADGFSISAMSTTYNDQVVGIMAGQAPEGTASIKVIGGPAAGATATADEGRFALWAPGNLQGQDVMLVALDANGKELARQSFAKVPGAPVVEATARP